MLAAAGLVSVVQSSISAAGVTFDTVALTGDPAPGVGPGVNFDGMGFTTLNDLGQTIFTAGLSGPGVDESNGGGIFLKSGSNLRLVARLGDPAPGFGVDATLRYFELPIVNNNGQIAFLARVTGPGVSGNFGNAVYMESDGVLDAIAKEGDPAGVSASGIVFDRFIGPAFPSLNDLGQIAFYANLAGSGVDFTNNNTLILGDSSSLNLIAREGDPVPGLGPNVKYGSLNYPVSLNNAGQLATNVPLSGDDVDPSNDRGTIMYTEGGLRFVVREGDPYADAGEGVTFRFAPTVALNNAGQTAFSNTLIGPGVDDTNDRAIFLESDGTIIMLAREGDPVPGTGTGAFEEFSTPALNDNGHFVFRAGVRGLGVDGSNNRALFVGSEDAISLLVRAGDAVPGTGPGVFFLAPDLPILSDTGQVAFRSRLFGEGIDSQNDAGVFATDPNGALHLVVRKGDLFDVNPDPLLDDLRTVSYFEFHSEDPLFENEYRYFNSNGQLALRLDFTDGTSGVFVATIAAALLGDYNASGLVEQGDLDLVLSNWGVDTSASGVPSGWVNDLPSGLIEQGELDKVLSHWGGTSAPDFRGASVPEPAALALALLALAALTAGRSPRRRSA